MTLAISQPAVKVEEVTARIIPAPGVRIMDAINDAKLDGINELEIRQKENDALLSIFKRKPSQPALEFVDGVLYFRCAVPSGAPSIAVDIDAGIVTGKVRNIVVFDLTQKREWSRSRFADGLDLSAGGLLTITQE